MNKLFPLLLFSLFVSIPLVGQDAIALIYQPPSYHFLYKVEVDSSNNPLPIPISDSATRNHAYILRDSTLIAAFKNYYKKKSYKNEQGPVPWVLRYSSDIPPILLDDNNYQDSNIASYRDNFFEKGEPYYLYEGLVPASISIDSLRKVLVAPKYYLFPTSHKERQSHPSIKVIFGLAAKEKIKHLNHREVLDEKAKSFVAALRKQYPVISWKKEGGGYGPKTSSTEYQIIFQIGTDLKGVELLANNYQTEIRQIERAFPYWILIASKEKNSQQAITELQQNCPTLKAVIKY